MEGCLRTADERKKEIHRRGKKMRKAPSLILESWWVAHISLYET
jgi:hypothetical protein